MKTSITRMFAWLAFVAASTILATQSQADPISPGDLLKFDQQPMVNTAFGAQIYFGHDELSTAYGVGNTANPPRIIGVRSWPMTSPTTSASPVVHVTWWGSYIDDNNAAFRPNSTSKKFLIAFESDVPAQPGGFSRPGQVLQYDVVTLGAARARIRHLHGNAVPRLPGDPVRRDALQIQR